MVAIDPDIAGVLCTSGIGHAEGRKEHSSRKKEAAVATQRYVFGQAETAWRALAEAA